VYDTITGKFLEYFHDFVQYYLEIEIFEMIPIFSDTCEAAIFEFKKFAFSLIKVSFILKKVGKK